MEVSRAALVRDILYVFQDIFDKNIKKSNTGNCYKVKGKTKLNKPLRDAVAV